MTDLYLIAHKVRNEPAFDIATRMPCPSCNAEGCFECDDLGYWWIISTSGHRAYSYAHFEFAELMVGDTIDGYVGLNAVLPEMPHDLPDHYNLEQTVERSSINLIDRLGLKPKPPALPFPRRI